MHEVTHVVTPREDTPREVELVRTGGNVTVTGGRPCQWPKTSTENATNNSLDPEESGVAGVMSRYARAICWISEKTHAEFSTIKKTSYLLGAILVAAGIVTILTGCNALPNPLNISYGAGLGLGITFIAMGGGFLVFTRIVNEVEKELTQKLTDPTYEPESEENWV